jgi:hypothetical protein
MTLFRNGFILSETMTTMAIGAGAVLLAPVLVPMAASIVRPVAKAAIKGGLMAYEGAKLAIAETKETIEDIAAEAQAEVSAAQKASRKSPPAKKTA